MIVGYASLMDIKARVSSVEFSAYLLCPTKSYLLGRNEPAPDTFFAKLDERILDAYRISVLQNSEICLPGGHPIEFSELEDNHKLVPPPRAVDCTTAWYFREQRTPQLPRGKKAHRYFKWVN